MSGDALNALEKVDWNLPGMENIFEHDRRWIKKSIEQGDIVNSIHCLGWAFWPVKNGGYYDERVLRVLADFLEIQNKPFWDEYNAYCDEMLRPGEFEQAPEPCPVCQDPDCDFDCDGDY